MSTELSKASKFDDRALTALLAHPKTQEYISGGLDAEELRASVMLAALKNQDILAAVQTNPGSVVTAIGTAAAQNLKLDGKQAALVPFRNNRENRTDCQLIIGYIGLVALMYRAGVQSVDADMIYEGDVFRYRNKTVDEHVPWEWRTDARPEKKGDPIGAWASVVLPSGVTKYEVMTTAEINAIKNRSRAGKSGPWVTDYAEMAKKTVVRRIAKLCPLSADLQVAVQSGDDDTLLDVVTPAPSVDSRPVSAAEFTQMLGQDSIQSRPPATTPETQVAREQPPVEAQPTQPAPEQQPQPQPEPEPQPQPVAPKPQQLMADELSDRCMRWERTLRTSTSRNEQLELAAEIDGDTGLMAHEKKHLSNVINELLAAG